MCEYPEYANRTQRVARKEHRCCECRGVIKPGEKYSYVFGVWSGDVMTFKTCPDCNQLRFEYDVTHPNKDLDEMMPFEGLYEWLDGSKSTELLRRFREIQLRRGAKNPIPEIDVPAGKVGEDLLDREAVDTGDNR